MLIHSKFKDYEVLHEKDLGFLKDLCHASGALFVIDEKVYGLYEKEFSEIPSDKLMLIEATEENKVIETVLAICEKMTGFPEKRNARLISVGGGIIEDITGFAANILYRGIPWTFVPTTLLSACDSCIGGKTGLNFKKFKNLLGTFYAPDVIHVCPEFFKTLSEKDYESGLGEVLKFNLILGEEGLSDIEKKTDLLLLRDVKTIHEAVEKSLLFKRDFIEADEFDRGERIKLNFAHTFGHAIETVTDYKIPHGTAVAIGMIMADRISLRRGLLSPEREERSRNVLKKVIHTEEDLEAVLKEDFLAAIRKDKKQTGSHLTAVLLTDRDKDLRIIHDLTEEEAEDAWLYAARFLKED